MAATAPKTLTVRCRPFTGTRVAAHKVRVETDGSVTVWDEVAGHYTRCHVLSEPTCRRIRRLAAARRVPLTRPNPGRTTEE